MIPEEGDPAGLASRCHGSGMLVCRCMGDGCCCGFHGYTECLGCRDCDGEDWEPYEEDPAPEEVER